MPKNLTGKVMYGTWNDGSSVFKDSKGYYIVTVKSATTPLYKKYLKRFVPNPEARECLVNKRWTRCSKQKRRTTRKK
jgi:hypothetical protein